MIVRHLVAVIVISLLSSGLIQGQQQKQSRDQTPNQTKQSDKDEKARKPRRKRVVTDLSGFDLLKSEKRRPMVVGATRGSRPPVALAPRLGKVYGANPTFAWAYEGKTKSFVLVLRDDSQEEILRTEVEGTIYTYPSDAPALAPGSTYFWSVQPSSFLLNPKSAPVGVLVVSSEEQGEIGQKLAQITSHDPYQAGLARAQIFTEHRLWYDAIAAYSNLIKQYPERGELFEERGMIYAQLDPTQELAEQDFARAEGIQDEVAGQH